KIVDAAAQRRGHPIPVIYDAAHTFGPAAVSASAGPWGSARVFSLSTTKLLVSVEGGIVASHNVGLVQRIKKMRNYGLESGHGAFWPGLNGRMSELHAAVGLSSLQRLPALMAARQRMVRAYADRLTTLPSFRLASPEGVAAQTLTRV